jgi:sensor domain CHASE-containing protein
MIKYFRKIRKKLLTENKFSKYLLYAIGEIILVVVGILIAVQLNNQNEFRKQKLIEIDILDGIRNDILTRL